MEGSPYNKFIELIRAQGSYYNPITYVNGIVIETLPDILIKVEQMQIDKNDILISENLTKEGNLLKGDKVLIIPRVDGQRFMVVCKLISLV